MSTPPSSVPSQKRQLGGAKTGPTFCFTSPWMKNGPISAREHEQAEDREADERLRVRDERSCARRRRTALGRCGGTDRPRPRSFRHPRVELEVEEVGDEVEEDHREA